MKNRSAFICPSAKPYKYTDMYKTLGVRHRPQDIPSGYLIYAGTETGGGGDPRYQFLRINKIMYPTDWIHLGDSCYRPGHGPNYDLHQCYYLHFNGGGLETRIHIRHMGLANMAFADGHVEACTKYRIKQAAQREKPGTRVEVVENGAVVKIN